MRDKAKAAIDAPDPFGVENFFLYHGRSLSVYIEKLYPKSWSNVEQILKTLCGVVGSILLYIQRVVTLSPLKNIRRVVGVDR